MKQARKRTNKTIDNLRPHLKKLRDLLPLLLLHQLVPAASFHHVYISPYAVSAPINIDVKVLGSLKGARR